MAVAMFNAAPSGLADCAGSIFQTSHFHRFLVAQYGKAEDRIFLGRRGGAVAQDESRLAHNVAASVSTVNRGITLSLIVNCII